MFSQKALKIIRSMSSSYEMENPLKNEFYMTLSNVEGRSASGKIAMLVIEASVDGQNLTAEGPRGRVFL